MHSSKGVSAAWGQPPTKRPRFWLLPSVVRVKIHQGLVCIELKQNYQRIIGRELTKPTSLHLPSHSTLSLVFPSIYILQHPQNSDLPRPTGNQPSQVYLCKRSQICTPFSIILPLPKFQAMLSQTTLFPALNPRPPCHLHTPFKLKVPCSSMPFLIFQGRNAVCLLFPKQHFWYIFPAKHLSYCAIVSYLKAPSIQIDSELLEDKECDDIYHV